MIHERGYWSKAEYETHLFDELLCRTIIESYSVKKVIDIGCGNGSYTREFIKAGIQCEGYDGNPDTKELTGGLCNVKDFSQPLDLKRYDLTISLEVGEHIPKQYEKTFLDNITCAKTIILSWAIPGQGGTGHFNEQPNEYIISEMEKRGYKLNSSETNHLRTHSILPWFKNTLFVLYD
jgi:SAM-dependent methyltransferase